MVSLLNRRTMPHSAQARCDEPVPPQAYTFPQTRERR